MSGADGGASWRRHPMLRAPYRRRWLVLLAAAATVILLHDGGGPREQTLVALESLLPWLIEQGYSFAPPA